MNLRDWIAVSLPRSLTASFGGDEQGMKIEFTSVYERRQGGRGREFGRSSDFVNVFCYPKRMGRLVKSSRKPERYPSGRSDYIGDAFSASCPLTEEKRAAERWVDQSTPRSRPAVPTASQEKRKLKTWYQGGTPLSRKGGQESEKGPPAGREHAT